VASTRTSADDLTAAEADLPVDLQHPAGLPDAPAPLPDDARSRRWRGLRITKRRVIVNVCRLAILVGFLALWEWGSGNPRTDDHVLVDEFFVSSPSAIWDALTGWIEEGVLWDSIYVTLQETVIGFFIGATLGLVIGFVLGVNGFLSAVFRPFITALNSIPRLALVPLFILWFGLGINSKLALVATIVFFLVFYSTYEGVADVDRQQLDVLRLMKARRWQLHAKVTLPSAMTWIIAGLRVSVPYALVAAVTAEMIASNRGMGYLVVRSSGQFFTAGVFAGIFVLIIMALVLTGLVTLLERRLLRWKPGRLTDPLNR
jgi:NitT/TauT family transport system permease protein